MGLSRREAGSLATGLAYLAPSLILFAAFVFIPLGRTIYLSLFNTRATGAITTFAGLDHYIELLTSPTFHRGLVATTLFALYTVPLGIALGLFLGKQIGVFGSAALVIRAGWARLPNGASWRALYGTSILTGIGFTMSLFIGTLAFGESKHEATMRLGVLVGSALSTIVGAIVLSLAARGSIPTSRSQSPAAFGERFEQP